ncbi:MAG: hypoxanthine phosphoribosyltransferase, partial [Bacteroidetes bacterium]
KNPVFVVVLNGAFMFAADLLKHITIPCEVTFVKVTSYEGETSTGKVKSLIGLKYDLTDREVVIVEDIVDTGQTIEDIIGQMKQYMPEDIHIATLLYKPEAYTKDIPIEYVALEVPNDFLVGYGLDYDEQGRNLKDIYAIVKEEETIQT